MSGKKQKYYVVWEGKTPGIYKSWEACKAQIEGVKNARYRSFESIEEARLAFENPNMIRPKESGKSMYYVVWQGLKPGIYSTWESCQVQIQGFPNPKYKSFGSKVLAEEAFNGNPDDYTGKSFKKIKDLSEEERAAYGSPIPLSLCVDAACSGKTGDFEYRGVITETGTEVFHVGPLPKGTNNIGEFLALVHALAYLQKIKSDMPIYSDSKYAMAWVKQKKANTLNTDPKTGALVKRAEEWLKKNSYKNEINKWPTHIWGEIPADFGRK